jgi:hypothetical protein
MEFELLLVFVDLERRSMDREEIVSEMLLEESDRAF